MTDPEMTDPQARTERGLAWVKYLLHPQTRGSADEQDAFDAGWAAGRVELLVRIDVAMWRSAQAVLHLLSKRVHHE